MRRYLLTLMLAGALAVPAYAQEADPEADATESVEEPEESEDDSDLDEQGYSNTEDDDFVPSEDIPADQAIPFPTDI